MRSLLTVPAALAVVFLSACGGTGTNDPQNDAFSFCEQQVAATFDDPDAAEFDQWTGGGTADEQRYEFESTVTADGETFDLTCTVTGEQGSFLLESYQLTPAG
jgi:hypothetical protein